MVEQPAVNRRVIGSSPISGATFTGVFDRSEDSRTESANREAGNSPAPAPADEPTKRAMRFPVRLKYRNERAVIYGKSRGYPYYRVTWHAGGRRVVRSYGTYSEAKEAAERAIRQNAEGNLAAGLSKRAALDATAAQQALDELGRELGHRVSLLEVVSAYTEAVRKLGGRDLVTAVEGFMTTVATVRRVPLDAAVEEFIAGKATPNGGRGSARGLNPVYLANITRWLREFASTFSGLAVADLTKAHLEQWGAGLAKLAVGAKGANDRKNAVRAFLRWASRRDLLPSTARLLEAEPLRLEAWQPEAIECYSPTELRKLLDAAGPDLRPIIAIQAFAGLRQQEVARLTWGDVFRVDGHVEVSAAKSKTRSRRLVEIPPTLAAWLDPYRHQPPTAKVWTGSSITALALALKAVRERCGVPLRVNGLRHGWVSAFYAITSDENRTASQGGTSPTMIHGHYKGLLPRQAAEAWFAILPETPANVLPLALTAGGRDERR